MAQLTSDIVWLVEQTVTLPDGSTQQALVPQVYVRVRPGDIDGSGALLSADATVIKSKGDMVNTGTIAGRSLVAINAENVRTSGGASQVAAFISMRAMTWTTSGAASRPDARSWRPGAISTFKRPRKVPDHHRHRSRGRRLCDQPRRS
jgi:large exoprotein involved in heme utilization and adhesion